MGWNLLMQVTSLPSLMAIGIVVVRYDESWLSRDPTKQHDQIFMWIYGQELINVSYHPAKFDCHRHPDNWDIVILVCHVNSQHDGIKESCDIIGRIQIR